MRETIKKIPLVGPPLLRLWRALSRTARPFRGSEDYWIQRYASGGNSGSGSHDQLARFKADVLNEFVRSEKISTVIEFGCGDGQQLRLAEYPAYVGFDISPRALELCRETFRDDQTKNFRLMSAYRAEMAELTLSLDVIYHLIEDDVFNAYMERLFDAADKYVIIYSSDFDKEQEYHERRRQFTRWIAANRPQWKLKKRIPNSFPYNVATGEGSLSDFYIYAKD